MYDYLEQVKEDVKNAIIDNYTAADLRRYEMQELEEKLHDELWINDSVTGNASGSHTFNAYQAEEYLCHNWDLLQEAFDAFGVDYSEALEKGAEYCDVTIRCYLLSQAISEVLNEIL